ncbi:MAG: hypothetical protein G01um1014106_167 [Parcubacteria group bacterium Gr01-1014_106]|nr:MAG: hypothetical protein G01um1014106_167 [Parcubacteria group bacterium Gr01-1014_106]
MKRIARRVELGSDAVAPAGTVFTEKNELFRITLPRGWKEVATADTQHPWWKDAKNLQAWTFEEQGVEPGWTRLRIFRFPRSTTLDDVRARVRKRVATFRDIATTAGVETASEKEIPVGSRGGRGIGYERWTTNLIARTHCSRYEVFVFFAGNGVWNLQYESLLGPLQSGRACGWDGMLNSFTITSASDGNLSVYLANPVPLGRTPKLLGLEWDGGIVVSDYGKGEVYTRELVCSWAADQFAVWYLGCQLPPPPKDNYWVDPTPGFRKVPYTGNNLPPPGSLLLFDQTATSKKHIVVVLASDPRTKTARVIEGNSGGRKGYVWDVHLPSYRSIEGWLVRDEQVQ